MRAQLHAAAHAVRVQLRAVARVARVHLHAVSPQRSQLVKRTAFAFQYIAFAFAGVGLRGQDRAVTHCHGARPCYRVPPHWIVVVPVMGRAEHVPRVLMTCVLRDPPTIHQADPTCRFGQASTSHWMVLAGRYQYDLVFSVERELPKEWVYPDACVDCGLPQARGQQQRMRRRQMPHSRTPLILCSFLRYVCDRLAGHILHPNPWVGCGQLRTEWESGLSHRKQPWLVSVPVEQVT